MMKIAIIGAGLSGLTAAHILKDKAKVTLFEKSRGVSGRMSTRYADPYRFDHGAQFFSAKTDAFKNFIQPMIDQDIIQRWDARFVEFENNNIVCRRQWDEHYPHYVGAPGMNAIAKHLSTDLDIVLNTRILPPKRHNHMWSLMNEEGQNLGDFDWVISTAPAAQAIDLLPETFTYLSQIKNVKMKACFALMLGFEKPLPLEFDAALVREADISWISVNSSKPNRDEAFCMLINSTNNWAEAHFEDDCEAVLNYLCDQTSEVTGYDMSVADHKAIHGWRYANIDKQDSPSYIIDHDLNIAACGDWYIQGRVESAFTSGYELANELLCLLKE